MSEVSEGAGRAGWTLVQLSELVRRAEGLLLDGITLAGPHAHAELPAGAAIEVGADALRRIAALLAEGVEIAERLELLAHQLPDAGLAVPYEAVRDAAAAELMEGIIDPRRVLLAARVLDVAHGWRALAASLAIEDVVAAWGPLSVAELLKRFRGADPQLVAGLVADAGLEPDARFAACAPEQLAALASGLRRHASGQPAA